MSDEDNVSYGAALCTFVVCLVGVLTGLPFWAILVGVTCVVVAAAAAVTL